MESVFCDEPVFKSREDGGRRLAELLRSYSGQDLIVIALPRGGVPVAIEVAKALRAPVDVIVVRKIGARGQRELAIGALAEGGELVLNDELLTGSEDERLYISRTVAQEAQEVSRRAELFRGGRSLSDIKEKTVLIVDDGLATGMTAVAAVRTAKRLGAKKVVLAVPVCAADSAKRIGTDESVEVVCAAAPSFFRSVGSWYEQFDQLTDDEVLRMLNRAQSNQFVNVQREIDEDVTLMIGPLDLQGHLTVPKDAIGVVAFAHGSGSSRHSPRNQKVARALNEHGIATLLLDLLTTEEEQDRRNAFNIPLLADRMVAVIDWLDADVRTFRLPIGLFGASTGAAAALVAATKKQEQVSAVVSRGGRPDLVDDDLYNVHVPTLLIVGSLDNMVLELNRVTYAQIPCTEKRLEVVPNATHLFEESGALEQVVALTIEWFTQCFAKARVKKVSVR